MDIVDQILNDIAAAPSLDLIGQIWNYSAGAFANQPETLENIGQACQKRDAELRANGTVPPVIAPPVIAPPVLQPPVLDLPFTADELPGVTVQQDRRAQEIVQYAGIQPVSATPPGWMANASAVAIGTRDATGNGGMPALDTMRVVLVDLSCAAWDCGIDLSGIAELKVVSAASPKDCFEIASQMLFKIREHMARAK